MAHELIGAIRDAWDEVADREDLDHVVGMGADGTATILADHILDQAVLDLAEDMGLSVLSEESGFTDHGSDLIAVVDPLDGSRNAGRGIPWYCASVAIGSGSVRGMEAGCVLNLPSDDRYSAQKGGGFTLRGRTAIRRLEEHKSPMVGLSAKDLRMGAHDRFHDAGWKIRDFGATALELACVASGALDALLVQAPLPRSIDVAAGVLLVEEAGGAVVDSQDRSMPFDMPLDLSSNGRFLAVHDRQRMDEVPA